MNKWTIIFQKIKHNNYKLSNIEENELCDMLGKEKSIYDLQSHTLLYVFFRTHKSSEKNIDIVRKFLKFECDDYIRQAALAGFSQQWELWDHPFIEKYLNSLKEVLEASETSIEKFSDSTYTTIEILFHNICKKEDVNDITIYDDLLHCFIVIAKKYENYAFSEIAFDSIGFFLKYYDLEGKYYYEKIEKFNSFTNLN